MNSYPTPSFFVQKHEQDLKNQATQKWENCLARKRRLRLIYKSILEKSLTGACDCKPVIAQSSNLILFSITFSHPDILEINGKKIMRYIRHAFKRLGWNKVECNSELRHVPAQITVDNDPGDNDFPNRNYGKEVLVSEAFDCLVFEIRCSSTL